MLSDWHSGVSCCRMSDDMSRHYIGAQNVMQILSQRKSRLKRNPLPQLPPLHWDYANVKWIKVFLCHTIHKTSLYFFFLEWNWKYLNLLIFRDFGYFIALTKIQNFVHQALLCLLCSCACKLSCKFSGDWATVGKTKLLITPPRPPAVNHSPQMIGISHLDDSIVVRFWI